MTEMNESLEQRHRAEKQTFHRMRFCHHHLKRNIYLIFRIAVGQKQKALHEIGVRFIVTTQDQGIGRKNTLPKEKIKA